MSGEPDFKSITIPEDLYITDVNCLFQWSDDNYPKDVKAVCGNPEQLMDWIAHNNYHIKSVDRQGNGLFNLQIHDYNEIWNATILVVNEATEIR